MILVCRRTFGSETDALEHLGRRLLDRSRIQSVSGSFESDQVDEESVSRPPLGRLTASPTAPRAVRDPRRTANGSFVSRCDRSYRTAGQSELQPRLHPQLRPHSQSRPQPPASTASPTGIPSNWRQSSGVPQDTTTRRTAPHCVELARFERDPQYHAESSTVAVPVCQVDTATATPSGPDSDDMARRSDRNVSIATVRFSPSRPAVRRNCTASSAPHALHYTVRRTVPRAISRPSSASHVARHDPDTCVVSVRPLSVRQSRQTVH